MPQQGIYDKSGLPRQVCSRERKHLQIVLILKMKSNALKLLHHTTFSALIFFNGLVTFIAKSCLLKLLRGNNFTR